MKKNKFELVSEYSPSGDQPSAINKIVKNINDKKKDQVLLGATGTGKTYTMANVVKEVNMPTIILAHNKTLASQLYGELKEFFPNNKVEYFVSYFDYYQPEAYIPGSDTYIEKDSKVNEEIDRLRHSATASLLEREDVIIVSSVSCIYSVGDPNTYRELTVSIREGQEYSQKDFIYRLIDLQYERQDINFKRASFRVRGDVVDIIAAHNEKIGYKIEFFGDEIESIVEFDVITGKKKTKLKHLLIYPATHYVADPEYIKSVSKFIKRDMEEEVEAFKKDDKLLEAQRLEQRTKYDLELLKEVGTCNGIENYTRYFSKKEPGETPYTLLDFFPKDYLMIVDESHATLPQVRGMYNGDHARKLNLVKYGFRLKSALDNRPLKFEEFEKKQSYSLYVSATPAEYEIKKSHNEIAEQIIRPTGLLDPIIEIRPKENQLDDIIKEIKNLDNAKMLITTLTKKIAEDLTGYLEEQGIKVAYLHSDIKTLQRVQIINSLRAGKFDVLIGINLLREGLDIPEVNRVLILDADKEGFLRSTTSLIQTVGRAARNANGKVIFYADKITDSMQATMEETARRREKQIAYNKEHNIVPKTITKKISELDLISEEIPFDEIKRSKKNKKQIISELTHEMEELSKKMEYEEAAKIRDIIFELKGK